MNQHSGWLFDVYADTEGGIVLWLITDDGQRLRLRMDLPLTFYATGDFSLLREAWKFLQEKNVKLERTRRRDLFAGERDVMSVTVTEPHRLAGIVREVTRQLPELTYYDVDVPVSLHFIARTNVYLLGRCCVDVEGDRVRRIKPLDSPSDIDPVPLPLRVMTICPDTNPAVREAGQVEIECGKERFRISLKPRRPFLIALQAELKRHNPDVILTDYGDTWLFPQLKLWCQQEGLELNPNRDEGRQVLTRRADSYFAYGQVTYRGAQTHLFGRWHIDRRNAMSWGEYGLEGAMEQTRMTGLGVQEMARKSPGAGITALQMLTALQSGIMVPMEKQQAEDTKTLNELLRADRGGMIYQPLSGIHGAVAQIDFSSMYPSIIVKHNISPETVGLDTAAPLDLTGKKDPSTLPLVAGQAREGLVPRSLRPLLEKRLMLKNILSDLDPRDCRVEWLTRRASALKWLLVVCFGYLGYKNARFGKIESHEAVTAWSRELLLQAKDIAEEMGFTVLHMYVDCLFVQKTGCEQARDFEPLMKAITEKTGIPIALEGIFKWVVFAASKRNAKKPVPNQYFGAFRDGSLKYRGIELRRRDTTAWVRRIQLTALEILAQADTPQDLKGYMNEVERLVEYAKTKLRTGRVPLKALVVRQRVSRTLQEYRSPPPAVRAALQLRRMGRETAPGQSVPFIFTRGGDGVQAWDVDEEIDPRRVDTKRYCTLLERAMRTVLDPCRRMFPRKMLL